MQKLLLNKYIHSFWVTIGTIKLKTVGNGRVYTVTHRNDLVELFPDNDILADQVQTARLFFKSYIAFVFQISSLSLLFQFSISSYMFRINGKQRPIQSFLFFRVGLFMTTPLDFHFQYDVFVAVGNIHSNQRLYFQSISYYFVIMSPTLISISSNLSIFC